MSTLTPHQTKALDYKKHLSLTANAGSGKTFVLSKRYLEIALKENLPLQNLAAITFTDKAAGELYQKIAKEISERIITAKDEVEKEKLEFIRRQLVSANISTIHSFCLDILREHPVEADIDANFVPIDEIYADELIELSVDDVIRNSLENLEEQSDVKKMIRLFSSKQIFARELASALKHRRSVLLLAENLYNKTDENIAKEFFSKFLSYTESIVAPQIPQFLKDVEKINSSVLKKSSKNPIANEINSIISRIGKQKEIINILPLLKELKETILTQKGTVLIKGYLSSSNADNLHRECSSVENFLSILNYFFIHDDHNKLELELAKFGKTFIHFFYKALNLYNEKKRQEGYLDYEDILLLTQKILENEEVRKSLSEKFKYLMIDEYQDTNELQYNIFLPILDYLRQGNLFVVGDEKQSIYMFRDAELEVFSKTKSEILNSSGKESALTLPDSFRMAPNICLFVNFLFQNLFSNPNPLFNEVEHSDLICARDENVEGNVEILLADIDSDNSSDFSEADLVAERIIELINSPSSLPEVSWKDIAILCRKRKSFLELEKAFSKRNIPYSIIGGKGFFQRQSIYDIYNYFSFLLDQRDDTALVGILRSPFFNISDTQIFEISLVGESSLWEKLKAYAVKTKSIQRAVNILEENIDLVTKIEISLLLRKILTETGYISVISSKANAIQEEANINKLITLTINFFRDGFRTLYDYVDFLRRAINEIEDESQAAFSEEDNSVKIMTIHQAKGLEFPVVFLFNCGETTKKNSVRSKSLTVSKDFGLLTKIPSDENYFTDYKSAPIINLYNYISDRKNTAELKRLFYVAVTRAKNQLFISADLKSFNSPKGNSFIGLINEALNLDSESDNFTIHSNLKLLKKVNEEYVSLEQTRELKIPIIKRISSSVSVAETVEQTKSIKHYLTERINDTSFGEIISATKLSIFKQCPLKYKLIYQLGFLPLMLESKKWRNVKENVLTIEQTEFNINEESKLSYSDQEEKTISEINISQIKGTIIHRLLCEEVQEAKISEKVDLYFSSMFNSPQLSELPLEKLKYDIVETMLRYLRSDAYRWINNFDNYKNEFEIYCQHLDYYLFGIIDKLIFDSNRLIIIDYKTDSIPIEALKKRAEQYFPQLKFYGFIASKLFQQFEEIELRIVFILHPHISVNLTLSPADLYSIQQEIETMVIKVRQNSFDKQLNHCSSCQFALENECIVS